MKRILLTLILIVGAFLVLPFTTFAESMYIIDEADIFTDEQESKLTERIEEIRNIYDFEVTFVTTENTGNLSLESYLRSHPGLDQQKDGLVFGQNTVAREYHTVGRGYGVTVVSDAALDRIDAIIVPYLQDGDFYGAYDTYLDETIKFLDAAATGVPYEGESLTATSFLIAAAIGLGAGTLIAFAVTGVMKSKMNTAREKHEAASYIKQGSFILGRSNDRFLYENTTRTKIQKQKDSGSNSSRGGSGGGSY